MVSTPFSRSVMGLVAEKAADTCRTMPVIGPMAMVRRTRSSCGFTPSSARKASSFGVTPSGSSATKRRPCLSQKSRSCFSSRSVRSYFGADQEQRLGVLGNLVHVHEGEGVHLQVLPLQESLENSRAPARLSSGPPFPPST